ncbi:MAG TPA: biotin/lipoyl-containing protein [Burkholderiales bacterium]|nr:biotin/lipoyl-containing protein [Burkholderiales bacterium]
MTPEDLVDILQIFGSSPFARLELALGPVRLAVNRAAPATVARSVDPPPIPDAAQVAAPRLGIFHAGRESGAPAFVQPGTRVDADTTVGIIRVLQEQTLVKAGVAGTVVDVLVGDGEFVEYGQTLLRVCRI